MGIYLNPGADLFLEARRSKIYVDKTAMLFELSAVLGTQQKYVCVSRPRRFGKSMAANMICAYYDHTVADEVFAGLAVTRGEAFPRGRGACDVLRLNMQEFLSETESMAEFLSLLKDSLLWDLLKEYPDYDYLRRDNLRRVMDTVYAQTQRPFVIVIDEWDCIFREYPHDTEAQRRYLDFLRDWLKDKAYIRSRSRFTARGASTMSYASCRRARASPTSYSCRVRGTRRSRRSSSSSNGTRARWPRSVGSRKRATRGRSRTTRGRACSSASATIVGRGGTRRA